MKMPLRILLTLAILAPGISGAQVVADSSRRTTLEAIADVVDAPATDVDKLLAHVGNPFLANVAALPASSTDTVPVAEGEALLDAAMRAMSPTGLLAAGGQSYLSLADGSLCQVGTPFTLKLSSAAECKVIILSADDSFFTLRIDGAEKAFPYTDTSGKPSSD